MIERQATTFKNNVALIRPFNSICSQGSKLDYIWVFVANYDELKTMFFVYLQNPKGVYVLLFLLVF